MSADVRLYRIATADHPETRALEEAVVVQVRRLLALCPACASRTARQAQAMAAVPRLTERRLQILRLCADGLSMEQVASRLNLSTSTIKTHLMWLHTAFDVQSRVAMVAKALRAGVIE